MCGIAGLISAQRPANKAAVREMMDRMAHRGPDGQGLWASADGRAVLGHRRLAIIGLGDAGAQPMEDQAAGLTLTFNGEIYNYRELAARLAEEGASFHGHSDSEVLLAALARWGDSALTQLNGMFAFALLDRRAGRLLLARDRFGEKPLLVASGPGWFAFASEYKALFALEGVRPEPDESLLLRFLLSPAASLDRGPLTLFPAIQQLGPGEAMWVDLNTLEQRRWSYWSPAPRADGAALPPDQAAEAFGALLDDSVRLRLRADVPVGSCLSGGLDSSAIVCLARRQLGPDAPYHVFSGRFPGSSADEGQWMDAVAAATGVVRHEVVPSGEGLLADLPDFLWFNELPVDSGSQYAQWCVFRRAREAGVTVLLDGQGADEVLGGYEQFFAAYLADLAAQGEDVRAEEQAIRARYPQALSMRDQGWKNRLPLGLKRLLARVGGRGSDLLLGVRPGMLPAPAPLLAGPGLADVLQAECFGGFLTTLLRYGDRNSMAHFREVRLPFCDHRIAELALSLSARALMGDAETKRLLRRSMQGVLPEAIRTRWRKQGFQPPHEQWFSGALGVAAADMFASRAFAESGMWQAQWWRGVLARFRSGETGLARALWKPFVTESWRLHVLERLRALPRQPVFTPQDGSA